METHSIDDGVCSWWCRGSSSQPQKKAKKESKKESKKEVKKEKKVKPISERLTDLGSAKVVKGVALHGRGAKRVSTVNFQ